LIGRAKLVRKVVYFTQQVKCIDLLEIIEIVKIHRVSLQKIGKLPGYSTANSTKFCIETVRKSIEVLMLDKPLCAMINLV
jgi:hypothetical protein